MAETSDVNHETHDIPARVPVALAVGILISVPLLAALLYLYFELMEEPPAISLVFSDISEREASAPPLMPNPALVLPESIQRMEERLHSTGWVDREAGIVHMPIDRAMERLAERGLTDDLFPLSGGGESGADADRSGAEEQNLDSRVRGNDGKENAEESRP